MSKDGNKRFTIRTERRVSLNDLIDACGWTIVREDWTLDGIRTRKDVIDITKRAFDHEGDSLWTWTDNLRDESLLPKIRAKMEAMFPDLL